MHCRGMLSAAFLSKTVQRYDNFLKYQTIPCIFLLYFAAEDFLRFRAGDFLPGFKVLFRKNVAYIVAGEQSAGGGCEFAGAVAVGASD